MTTSRIVRGTKIRIFVCFCAIVVILGLVACYNNTISQLDETQKAVALCHQQQENLSTQLQVISDYKLRLEKALKTEKAEHVKSNSSFDQLLQDEKSKTEKNVMESKLRFDSLQQRYNLLQTEHDDFKEKIQKSQQKELDEISVLQAKLKEAQEEIKKVTNSKEKLKSDYLSIQQKNDNLRKQIERHELDSAGNENKTNYLQKQNIDLKRDLDRLKEKCPESRDTIQEPIILKEGSQVSKQNDMNQDQGQQNDQNVLVMPFPNNEKNNKVSSSTPSSVKPSSQGILNGARPIALPTMTPKNQKENGDVLAKPNANAVPQGVLPIPENLPEGVVAVDQNDNPNNIVDERYKNKIEESKGKKQEETEKENMGNEDLDQQNQDDGLSFGEAIKHAEKQNFQKQHIDNLGVFNEPKNQQIAIGAGDYKDGQVEENPGIDEGEDDDQDEYGDLARHKEVAVRN